MGDFFLLLLITGSALVWKKEESSNGSLKVSVTRNHKKGRLLFEILFAAATRMKKLLGAGDLLWLGVKMLRFGRVATKPGQTQLNKRRV